MQRLRKNRPIERFLCTVVFRIGLVIALVLPSSHIALVALVIAFLLWIVPDLRIVRLLDFLAEEQE